MKVFGAIITIISVLCLYGCEKKQVNQPHLLIEIAPAVEDNWVNMVVEIPAGSTEKWEVNKESGAIEPDSLNGKARIINYLGYPGNYGFIPQTLLPKSVGGDGDPLDIITIGAAAERGSILRCKIIGVLKLIDTGETDDKLIAIAENSTIGNVSNIEELATQYPGILEIIKTWFTNYKGQGKMVSDGYRGVQTAMEMVKLSQEAFTSKSLK